MRLAGRSWTCRFGARGTLGHQLYIPKQREYMIPGGKAVVLRDAWEKMVCWINRYRSTGDIAVQFDREHAGSALPWAASTSRGPGPLLTASGNSCAHHRPLQNPGWSACSLLESSPANQDDVLSWFADLSEKLAVLAEDYKPAQIRGRRPLAQPNRPIQGSTAERKLGIGFVENPKSGKDSRCHWSQILVPGELKSNPSADVALKAWLDIGRYAREVLAANDVRRFVLGFTICGSLMRIWEFDRLGGIASEKFNINKDGLQFVSTVLGFVWMDEEQLGFDLTITTEQG